MEGLKLSDDYISIQIRGGDKYKEVVKESIVKSADIIKVMQNNEIDVKNLFVFTDDYRYVSELKQLAPNWKIFTLTGEDERGYDNVSFRNQDMEYQRKNIIKLFAMVECCINSSIHVGYMRSAVDHYIRASKICNNLDYLGYGNVMTSEPSKREYR